MIRPLPAGLLDNHIEFFNDPVNLEISYCLTDGKVIRVRDASAKIRSMIKTDMDKFPEKVLALYSLGYRSPDQLMEKYVSCCFGAFDGQADCVNGKLIHSEYWPCPKRSSCPTAGILCNPLFVDHGVLSGREIEVLTLVAKCKLDKEIADTLNLSVETVKIHLKNIRRKAGKDNKMDLVTLAQQKNLI